MNKQEAISILKEHNQKHVIKRLEALGDDAAKKLISQVLDNYTARLSHKLSERFTHLVQH